MLELFDPFRGISTQALALRMVLAVCCGSLIGIEREFKRRPAGFRTHILVCMGAMLTTLTSEYLLVERMYAVDPARLGAQVIAGIGFVGAGTIIVTKNQRVKGLTTAASVWAVACLGIAAGFGYYALALVGMLFTLTTLTVFEALQRKLVHSHSAEDRYLVTACDVQAALEQINAAAAAPKITVLDLTTQKQGDTYRITFRAWFVGRKAEKHRTAFFAALAKAESIHSVTNITEAKV